MKLVYLAVPAILAVVIAAVIFAGSEHHAKVQVSSQASPQTAGVQAQRASQSSNATLFNGTVYSHYAYLVSGQYLSSQGRYALDGFNVSRIQEANGTVIVKVSLSSSIQNQSISIAPGNKLYFIEATMGDDGYDFDSSLGDDGFVMVNSTGYVV